MAKEPYPAGLIQRLVEEGATATGALREFREAGGAMRTQTWYRMWESALNEQALHGVEEGKPLGEKPQPEDVIDMVTRSATGYSQRVQVIGRNAEGYTIAKTENIVTSELMTREDAMMKAIERVEGIPREAAKESGTPPIAVVAVFYGGTYKRNPEG